MNLSRLFALSLILILSLLIVSPAYALTDQQDICEDNGGTWTGADAFNGYCEYPFGNTTSDQECGEHGKLTTNFSNGALTGSHCSFEPTPGGAAGDETSNGLNAITLQLGQGKNGSVTFSPGACPVKCTISANLHRNAKNALPSEALATLSVRIVGNVGGSYLVCFKTAGLDHPTIYKFVGGAWVRIAMLSTANRICASTTGNASFYLGSG
ncbi:MAG TPA: hypothetical protein VLK33_20680 [Terriglobales bacterium]|nr:hypothetical protein [Terriglobales bacterium]